MGTESEIQKSYFDVLGLCCSSEVPLIEKILKPLDGVQKVSVIVPSKTVIVVHDTLQISQLQIAAALNQARLEASIRSYDTDKAINKWPSPYTLASGLLLLASVFQTFFRPLQWLSLAAVVIGLPKIILRSFAAIQRYTLDVNILMLIAVGGAVSLGDYLEAGSIVFLFSIAEWLESMASYKATSGMSSLMSMAPQKAILAETGQIIDAKDVMVGTVIAVKAGDVIPIDGFVVEGRSEVDEKSLTGEPFHVAKQPQSLVWAGTLNIDGYISVKTTALAEHSAVAKMARLVEEAQNNRSRTQRTIDSWAKYYTPAVVVISAVCAVVPLILRVHNQKHWFKFALVLLVSACPCAVVLSTPVATFCALLKAARTGLLVKGGDVLETLAKTKVVAFDKTGTITRGEFSVVELRPLTTEVSMPTLLSWISSIESKSSHPMASALVDYSVFNSIEPNPEQVTDFQIYPGEGVSGEINGKKIYIGNRRIAMRAASVTAPNVEDMKEAVTVGYVFLGAMPIGIFTLSDNCRTGAKECIDELKSMGIRTVILTGDSNASAMHAQKQLGHAVEEVHAELLPKDKVQIISDLKRKEGSTTMVGDGMNDAPALATANVGISMGISGSAVAMDTSHITLMSNDIRKIPKAIRLARRMLHKIIVNIIFSVLAKIAILGLAIGGHPLVWAAVLADVGTCLIVTLNSVTLLHKKQTGKTCCKKSNNLSCQSNLGCHKERPTCTHSCTSGPCGSNYESSHSNHGSHKKGSVCHAESPAQCCKDQVRCKQHARYEHMISMTYEDDSSVDDSWENHIRRHNEYKYHCQGSNQYKMEAHHHHMISLSSEHEHKEDSSCKEHSSGLSDHSHCHHESTEHETKSNHEHSNAHPYAGDVRNMGTVGASSICRESDKSDAGSCESERQYCQRRIEGSKLPACKTMTEIVSAVGDEGSA